MKFKSYILNEASKKMSVSEFISATEKAIRKSFPKSFLRIRSSKGLGTSIDIAFTIGKDKSEWSMGIPENDPMLHKFMIAWNQFTDNTFTSEKILAEINQGGSLTVQPEEGSYMAFGSIKIGWRKKTATPDKIVKHFENYFKKAKKVLRDNKDKLDKRHYELIKKHI